MRVLLDLNIVLDFFLVRAPWYVEAVALWDANRDGKITSHVAAFSIPTISYIVRKQTDLGRAERAVDDCLASLTTLHRSSHGSQSGSLRPVIGLGPVSGAR